MLSKLYNSLQQSLQYFIGDQIRLLEIALDRGTRAGCALNQI